MIWFVSIVGYLIIGFIAAVVVHFLDLSDIHEDLMVLAFMVAWPLIIVGAFLIWTFLSLGTITTKLGDYVVRIIKRRSKK